MLFLPAMHKRYTYALDILLLILACMNIKYVVFTFLEIVISLYTYSIFLMGSASMMWFLW